MPDFVIPGDQKLLLAFLKRRHPEYDGLLSHWLFLQATYEGGRDWFDKNIHKYFKEGPTEYKQRIDRAYRFNHTRETVDLVQKYIFKSTIARNWDDAPGYIQKFWENATLSGLDIDQFMRLVSTQSAVSGRVWIFVDSNKSDEIRSVEDEREAGARTYAYTVKVQDVLDVGMSETGDILWVLVRETARDDADPIFSTGDVTVNYRLWTRNSWALFTIVNTRVGGKEEERVQLLDAGDHELGVVPGFPHDHVIGEHRYSAPAMINDIAYLDRAVANYLSNLDAIIQDQTFSQLAIPAQAMSPGTGAGAGSDDDPYAKILEMGTKRIFTYDGEGGARPEFISPDPRQAQLIVEVINKIINEIYHTLGLAGERTKQDNSIGIDNSSGVAKAYDFERVNSLLASKADSLENSENRLVDLINRWHGRTPNAPSELVKYPDTFDVRSLFDEFTVAERLALIEAPDGIRREQMKQVIEKLFPDLTQALKEKMRTELEQWPKDPIEQAAKMAVATAPPSSFDQSKRNPQTQNRQGQVTAASD